MQIGGAGEAAGIKVGDQLLSINGQDATTLTHAEVEEALSKEDAAELVVLYAFIYIYI